MTLQEKSLATIELPKILEMLAAEALGAWVTGVRRSASRGWGQLPCLCSSIYFATLATTLAMASGQEVQLMPC